MELISMAQIVKFLAALLFVLALMGGLALALRRLHGKSPMTMPHKRRLKVIETLPLDARRRLVLLKRDDREHLIVLGANGETVIETGIESRQDEAND